MDIDKYLARIGFTGDCTPSVELLYKLHALHVGAIAFENINPYIGVMATLAPDELYSRIIEQLKGGGCYELNGLFHELLLALKFSATLLPAKLYKGGSVDSASLHAVIAVVLQGKTWYVDPGYGEDGIVFPLEMTPDIPQKQLSYFYRFTKHQDKVIFSRSKTAKKWTDLLLVDQTPVALSYFDERAHYHQTNTNSWFKNNFTCSLLSESSQKILLNTKFTCSSPSKRTTTYLKTEDDLFDILVHTFGISVSKETAKLIFSKLTATL